MHRFAWVGVSLLLLLLLLVAAVVGAPLVVARYAQAWLVEQGVEGASIEDVDLNPFAGTLRVESLRFPGPDGKRGAVGLIQADFEWTSLFTGQPLVAGLAVTDVRIDVRRLEDGRLAVGGLIFPLEAVDTGTPVQAAETDPWPVGMAGAVLENIELTYHDQQFSSELTVRRASLGNIATWDPEAATPLAAELNLDGADISVEADLSPLALEPRVRATLSVDGIALAAYAPLFQPAGLSDPKGLLSFDLELRVRSDSADTAHVEMEGDVRLIDLALATPMGFVENGRFDWSGNMAATFTPGAADPLALAGTFELETGGLAIRQTERTVELVALQRLAIRGANIDGLDAIRVPTLEFDGLRVLRAIDDGDATLSIAHGWVEEIDVVDRSAVSVARVRVDTMIADVVREQGGQLKLITQVLDDLLPATSSDDEAPPEPTLVAAEGAPPPAFTFYIAEVVLGGDSRIRYRDNAVTPSFVGELKLESLRLAEFGNRDTQQPANLTLAVRQGDTTKIVAEGQIAVFATELGADITVNVQGLDLSQLSPYVPGYHVQRGRLSLESHASLMGNALDVSNAVVVEKLALEGKAAGELDWAGEGLAMPLSVALDLLRDRKDRIVLQLPIAGSLQDPQFGTADVVRVATQKALQNAAISYAKNALQPLGTIMFAAKIVGKVARPRFEPVSFGPGDTVLSAESQEYLDKVAQLLDGRPGLSITFCGVSTAADLQYLRAQAAALEPADAEAADVPTDAVPPGAEAEVAPPPTFEAERLEIARARGAAVQNYLTTTRGVDAKRLFTCRATLESDDGDPPRVEIML